MGKEEKNQGKERKGTGVKEKRERNGKQREKEKGTLSEKKVLKGSSLGLYMEPLMVLEGTESSVKVVQHL